MSTTNRSAWNGIGSSFSDGKLFKLSESIYHSEELNNKSVQSTYKYIYIYCMHVLINYSMI